MGLGEMGLKSEIPMAGNTRDVGSKLASRWLHNFLTTAPAPVTYPAFVAPAVKLEKHQMQTVNLCFLFR